MVDRLRMTLTCGSFVHAALLGSERVDLSEQGRHERRRLSREGGREAPTAGSLAS
jgi:hypothetical protein